MSFDINFRNYFLLFTIAFLSISCNSQNCSDLKESFTDFDQAKKSIERTNFRFSDKCNTRKSSWILGAEFYSCDNKNGYLLIKTKKKTYIHKNLPKELWNEFKKADSFGKFYNSRIKGKFQLII
ncbi:KTSC domain-containing protein [Flagellimonas abyssi]|uniref:KTSC domain-containing protein n=1 Tax=Flagellimonas abyssi TaxID=2864871 RepID=A0ABS7EWP2_9FLAO|nr:KTSC domain-containing protein [Allomuricauda abyssi]MBW8202019.1 KTSC domain-containing protein [Allomuricauda abyssi]